MLRARSQGWVRLGSLVATIGVCAAVLTVGAPPVAADPAPLAAVVVDGRGFGHGVGLSQWGAYGLAVDHGWDWLRILNLYYGGTTNSPVQPADFKGTPVDKMTVRLMTLDGAQTSVVSDTAQLQVQGDPVAGRTWGSAVFREVGPNVYRAYVRADAVCAPGASVNLDDPANGWTVLWPANQAGPVNVTTPNANSDTAAVPGDLVGLCEPSGAVRYYRGTIRAANDVDGSNHTVNEVGLEWYVKGVVPRESSAGWADAGGGNGINALRAQAVAARSYSLAEGGATGRYAFAKTCDTTACQVYGGAYLKGFGALEDARSNRAVDDTRGIIRRTAAGGVANTMFSASNGGRTAGYQFPPVMDPGDGTAPNPNYTWSLLLSAATIRARFPSIGTPTSLQVTQRDNAGGQWNGYALQVRLTGTAGSTTISGAAFKSAFGLKSSWFELTNVPAASASANPVGHMLFVGDSVGASISDDLDLVLRPAYPDLQVDTLSGRCTIGACTGPDTLSVIRSSPTPSIALIETGYNDYPATFAPKIDQVMTELTNRGVRRVIWVNLSERRPVSTTNSTSFYAPSNVALRAATARWSNLTLLDWNAASAGAEPIRWFSTAKLPDGRADLVHLTTTGQAKFAQFLRDQLDALRATGALTDPVLLSTTPPPPPPLPALPFGLPLRYGDRGDLVGALQTALRAQVDPKIRVDGVYGTRVRSAVRTFEKATGLAIDGIAGEAVWRGLGLDKQAIVPVLRSGNRGAGVRALQSALRAAGQKVSLDGIYGTRTVRAVRAIQAAKGLPVNGVADLATRQALNLPG